VGGNTKAMSTVSLAGRYVWLSDLIAPVRVLRHATTDVSNLSYV
jgi:hypothetical protein